MSWNTQILLLEIPYIGTYIILPLSIFIMLLFMGNLFTYFFQKYFIMRPARLPQNFQYTFENEFEEKFFDCPDGGRINALHFKLDPLKRKGVVLYFHGNSGNLTKWGELNEDFIKRGYELLVFDYRTFGKSTGKCTEEKL